MTTLHLICGAAGAGKTSYALRLGEEERALHLSARAALGHHGAREADLHRHGADLRRRGLFFEGTGNDNQGAILDDIVLTAGDAPVPMLLPAGGMLLVSALGLLGARHRRAA